MSSFKKSSRVLCFLWLLLPLGLFAAIPVKSIVIFGDSISDNGNTQHLLKSLRNDESPAYLVKPLKVFVINKMIDFAYDYYVPQVVLDSGIAVVSNFFDQDLAPMLVSIIARIRLVPVIPGEPYWQGHFANGRVWNEYLAPMLDVDREDLKAYTNHAFGGSWAASYDYQLTVWNLIRHPLLTLKSLVVGKLIPPSFGLIVQGYLLMQPQLNEKTVFFVFNGANDYVNVLNFEDNYNPAVMSLYVNNVIDSIGAATKKLTQAGARYVVVLGLPEIGETPKFVHTMDRQVLNNAILMHNERLAKKVEEWKLASPQVDFLFIDVAPILRKALNNPEEHGFNNITDACIDVKFPMFHALTVTPFKGNFVLEYAQVLQYRDKNFAPHETNYHICDTPENYLFWDEIHPSTRAHRYLAYDICVEMKAHGYEANCEFPAKL